MMVRTPSPLIILFSFINKATDLEAEILRMEEEEQSLRQQLVACDLQRENQAQEMAYLKGEADKLTSFEERCVLAPTLCIFQSRVTYLL